MSIAVTFEITIKDTNIDTIATKLRNMGLNVLPYSIEDVGKDAFDPNSIMCTYVFPDIEALGLALALKSALETMGGVGEVKIMHNRYQRDKRPWYDHFMIPLLISSAVYSLGVLGVLVGVGRELGLNLDWMTYLFYLVIPAISSFWLGVGYIRYRQIF